MRIVIIGPTAVGKTETSLLLAEHLATDIISADSRQCYTHLDIGTAKPSQEELDRVNHYNISILNPDEKDTVADFSRRATEWDHQIQTHKGDVIYAGGSTLHLQSLIAPLDEMPTANVSNLNTLNERADADGLESLYKQLLDVDPLYASQMDGMNRQRIIRALDVWMQTGSPFSSFHKRESFELPEKTLFFGLHRERGILHQRINSRVDGMIKQELLQEIESILSLGYKPEAQALQTVGYRELIGFIKGEVPSLDEATEKIKTNTRRYAKRQMTWFKRWNFVKWIDADQKKPKEISEIMLRDLAAMQKKG